MAIPDEAIFDPNTITGVSNGSLLSTWADALGLHSATANPTGPTYVTNVVNGYPVARFNGSTQSMLTDMLIWSGPFTVTAVVSMGGGGNYTVLGNGTTNSGAQWRIDAYKQILVKQNVAGVMSSARQSSQLSPGAFGIISLKWVPASRYREAVVSSAVGVSVSTAGVYATNGEMVNTYWSASSVSTGTPVWLRVRPYSATAHTSYTITPRAAAVANTPRDFKVQGSMDASSWTDLDTRALATWSSSTPQTFTFSNTTAWTYYRMLVTAPGTVNLPDWQLGTTPARTGQFVSYVNGLVNGWGVRDVDLHVEFSESAWQIGKGKDGGELFAGDIAYLHITKGDVDDSVVIAEHAALTTRFALTFGTSTLTGTVSASSQYPSETAAMGADNNLSTYWTTNGVVAATYQFTLPSPTVVSSYSIRRRDEPWQTRNVKDWTFQGSNDGTSWTTLDTRTGVTWPTAGETKTFTCGNTTAYTYYRYNITANNGDVTYTSFTETWLNVDSSALAKQQPLGALIASTVYSAEWRTYFLTDGSVGGSSAAWSASTTVPATLKATTSLPSVIASYTLTARSDAPGSMVTAWTFEGSNDGSSWTTLDTRSGQSWTGAETKVFVVTGAAANDQYRWVMTAVQTGGSWPSFTELNTYGSVYVPPSGTMGFWGILQASA